MIDAGRTRVFEQLPVFEPLLVRVEQSLVLEELSLVVSAQGGGPTDDSAAARSFLRHLHHGAGRRDQDGTLARRALKGTAMRTIISIFAGPATGRRQ